MLVGMAIVGASLVSKPVSTLEPDTVWSTPQNVPKSEKPLQPRPAPTVTKFRQGPRLFIPGSTVTVTIPKPQITVTVRVTVTLPRKTVTARPQPAPTVTKTVRPSPVPGPTVTVTETVTAPATEEP
jgi:hypothetical protein